jgi:predicted histidine transporter YuiF (NhaC family)
MFWAYLAMPVGGVVQRVGIIGNLLDPQRMELETRNEHRMELETQRNDHRHAFTMVLCFALTVSVAVSIGLASILGIQVSNANMLISVKEMFNSINKFPLAAIPFFILAGNLMETGGISRRLVEFAKSLVGGVQGGLPMTCVLTCMIFAAVSGSSVATTFAIGAILIPALIKHGYPTSYAAALQATSAELGVIIPLDPDDPVRRERRGVDWRAVHRRLRPRHPDQRR